MGTPLCVMYKPLLNFTQETNLLSVESVTVLLYWTVMSQK